MLIKNKHKSFKKFLEDSELGESYIYHTGALGRERRTNEVLSQLADNVLEAWLDGKVDLVQKRYDSDLYHYIARRVDNPRRKWKGCYRLEGAA